MLLCGMLYVSIGTLLRVNDKSILGAFAEIWKATINLLATDFLFQILAHLYLKCE